MGGLVGGERGLSNPDVAALSRSMSHRTSNTHLDNAGHSNDYERCLGAGEAATGSTPAVRLHVEGTIALLGIHRVAVAVQCLTTRKQAPLWRKTACTPTAENPELLDASRAREANSIGNAWTSKAFSGTRSYTKAILPEPRQQLHNSTQGTSKLSPTAADAAAAAGAMSAAGGRPCDWRKTCYAYDARRPTCVKSQLLTRGQRGESDTKFQAT